MKKNREGQAVALLKSDFNRFLAIASPKHRAIAAMCWYTVERPSAVLNLKTNSVFEDSETIVDIIVFEGRTRKQRIAHESLVPPVLKNELLMYGYPSTPWLFPGRSPLDHLSFQGWSQACKNYFKKLNLPGHTTYSFRRGALTHMSNQGISMRIIQSISGHKSLDALQRYLDVDQKSLSKAIRFL